jgi:hypothetical protein
VSESDPSKLADELDRQAQDMQTRSDEVRDQISDVREDWQRKRAADSVPGAPAPESSGEADEGGAEEPSTSPAPEAPPEQAGPGSAETAAEGQAGPPADSGD